MCLREVKGVLLATAPWTPGLGQAHPLTLLTGLASSPAKAGQQHRRTYQLPIGPGKTKPILRIKAERMGYEGYLWRWRELNPRP